MDLRGLLPLFEAPFIWLLVCLISGAIAMAILETRRKP